MKALFGWVSDPCVHLFVIGLLLVHLAMKADPDPEEPLGLDRPAVCSRCHQDHAKFLTACPLLTAKTSHFDRH